MDRGIRRLVFAIVLSLQCAEPGGDAGRVAGPSLSVVAVPCGGDLRAWVEDSVGDTNTTLVLQPCLYQVSASVRDGYNTGIRIADKLGLSIEGAGPGATIVKFERPVYVGFEIRQNTSNLTIRDLTISGSVTQALCTENPDLNHPESEPPQWCYGDSASARPNTRGIGVAGSQTGIQGFLFSNLEVKDLAWGIEVPGGQTVISDNNVHDIHGTYPKSGYGIGNGATNVTIRNNVITRAGRHSIYQGGGSGVVIIDNTIVDHGHNEIYTDQQAALAVARSDNVAVISNKIVGGHAYGLSAEFDAPPGSGLDCTRCLLIGNKFINLGVENGAAWDIWISAHSPVWTWFNTRDHNAPAHVCDPGSQQEDVAEPGEFWGGTEAISSMYHADDGLDYLYVVQNDVLHQVKPDYGNSPETGWRDYRYSTTNWFAFFGMTASDGKVYVWQNDALHSVTPQWSNSPWPYTHSVGWFNPGAIAARGDGYVYVIQNFALHRVSPSDWSYILSTTQWPGPHGLALGKDTVDVVYVRSGNSVYKVKLGGDRTPWPWSVLDMDHPGGGPC